MMERFRWTYIEKTLAPTESNHHMSHKLAAFNVMIHRMINVPLSAQNFDKEYEKIIHIGEVNGANKSVIDIHIKKYERKKLRNECTSFLDAGEIPTHSTHCQTLSKATILHWLHAVQNQAEIHAKHNKIQNERHRSIWYIFGHLL